MVPTPTVVPWAALNANLVGLALARLHQQETSVSEVTTLCNSRKKLVTSVRLALCVKVNTEHSAQVTSTLTLDGASADSPCLVSTWLMETKLSSMHVQLVPTLSSVWAILLLVCLLVRPAQSVISAMTQQSHLRPVFQVPIKEALEQPPATIVDPVNILYLVRESVTTRLQDTPLPAPTLFQRCASLVRRAVQEMPAAPRSLTSSTLQPVPTPSTTVLGACTVVGTQ